MVSLPINISSWEFLRKFNSVYIDKTPYINTLECDSAKYVTFLRPRKFGKSLFISMLHHYYGVEHEKNFAKNFDNTYIGANPTPFANKYFVLRLEFTGIRTNTEKLTFDDFLVKVKSGMRSFFRTYKEYFGEKEVNEVEKIKVPQDMLSYLWNKVENLPHKIYILIDEYDHFAHQILAFHPQNFMNLIGKEGFVRKFYETIKDACANDIVERIFVTGISPITMDGMTSGFNITTSLTTNPVFHNMMGFTKEEVITLLNAIEVPENEQPKILRDLTSWYDGYLFCEESKGRLYNSDMVLYFMKEYAVTRKYPKNLLDVNIASDYSKIKMATQMGNLAVKNWEALTYLMENGEISAELTLQYSFEKIFTVDDFISFLYYMGLLTIKKEKRGKIYFKIPNIVIEKLYFDFYREKLLTQISDAVSNHREINEAISVFCYDDIPAPLIGHLCDAIHELAVRDTTALSEAHVKAMLISYLAMGRVYYIKSEYEVDRKFIDILLIKRPPFDMPYSFALELKYLPKNRESEFEAVKKEAIEQVKGYLRLPELQEYPDLITYLIIIVGEECKYLEKVFI